MGTSRMGQSQVIATAGHVDHGKSTLIRALTGMQTDRPEELRRGMTIDLGFAWTTLPGGCAVAFVDVPGHQRFVSSMLAGVGPVPAVLFVVAADEGWSAQSTEHLQALDALGVHHGVLALTRADLGNAEVAEQEAREHLLGSSLAAMPAVAVDSVSGTGMADVRAALDRLVTSMPEPADTPPRLWVDRVFTIRGAGTVVTGTLASGRLRVGDELEVRPGGAVARVRGLESMKAASDEVHAVSRVAVNLRGVRADQLQRGMALTAAGHWADVHVLDIRVREVRSASELTLPAELTLHIGSAAVPARVRPLGADTVRLTLAHPLPLHVGDRGVLRDPGARRVLGGAVVLDPLPPALARRGAARRRADELSGCDATPDLAGEVSRRRFVRTSQLRAIGVPVAPVPASVVAFGDWLVHRDQWAQWRAAVGAAVDAWAADHPLRPGMPRQALAAELAVPDESLLVPLAREDFVMDDNGVHRPGTVATLPPQIQAQLDLLGARLADAPFDAPEASELTTAGLTEGYLALAVRAGRLLRVGPGIYLRPDAVDEALRRLAAMSGSFTVAQARSALATSRRVAIPLLEYLDRIGRTVRLDADHRAVRPVPSE